MNLYFESKKCRFFLQKSWKNRGWRIYNYWICEQMQQWVFISHLFNVDHLYLKFVMSWYLFWDSPSAFSPSFSRPNLQTIIITYLSGIMCTNHFDKFRRNARTAPRITWQYKINACWGSSVYACTTKHLTGKNVMLLVMKLILMESIGKCMCLSVPSCTWPILSKES